MSSSAKGPSLADVAALAGVSISTVSKVANGSADVGEDTRARVTEILKGQQYVSKRKRSTTPTITLLVRSMTIPSTAEIMRGALAEAQQRGARIALVQHGDDEPDEGWIDQFTPRTTSAVIAIHSVLDSEQQQRLESQGIQLVVVNPKDAPNLGAYSIGATNWAGGLTAAQHLIGLGHRRIAMLCGDDDSMISRARLSGYREALEAAGLRIDADLVVPGHFTFESGLEQARTVLRCTPRPTAIVAGSDEQAMGAIEAARLEGARVPEDVSIVGFDDLAVASMTSPPLTSVRQPLEQMGVAAIGMALDLIERRDPRSHHTELATTLIERGSTAPPTD
ncbi:LacI family DNA-binding transcriptional regulator [Agromyces sp. SYSU T00194]|uniref:LacI family DNA-binding transcriptional regulator n=1 Tax=Agromyces chitinivorans TaxID=3158560 RepID=UPI00339369F8